MEMRTADATLLGAGVASAIGYGLAAHFAFGRFSSLASIGFLLVTPAVLGAISTLFAGQRALAFRGAVVVLPLAAVGGLALTLLVLRIEGMLCLLILAPPFTILAIVGAYCSRSLRMHSSHGAWPVLLVPFLLAPIEAVAKGTSLEYRVTSTVEVRAPAATIWNGVIRVPEIRDEEDDPGIFHALGVPRPIRAELVGERAGGLRTGHFHGGLRLVETISWWEPYRRISFSIAVMPATMGNGIVERHVLGSDDFRFIDATYEIEYLGDGVHALHLTSRYLLAARLGPYGRIWADAVLADFQGNLLRVLAGRMERVGTGR